MTTLRSGDRLTSGTCGRCQQLFAAIWRKGPPPVQECPRCAPHAARRPTTGRRPRPRRDVVDVPRDKVLDALRAPDGDMAALHDLCLWQRTTCPRPNCHRLVFPTIERAMFRACLYSASLGKRIVPFFEHGRWHLATLQKKRQGPQARARQQRARRQRQRARAQAEPMGVTDGAAHEADRDGGCPAGLGNAPS